MEHISMRDQKRNSVKKRGIKSRNRRSPAHKVRSACLVLGGLSAVYVGRKYGDAPRAVSYWVKRFKEHGAEGLKESPRSGRPSSISQPQLKMLQTFITETRAKQGVLSGRIFAEFIKTKFGVSLTRQQARRILNRLNS